MTCAIRTRFAIVTTTLTLLSACTGAPSGPSGSSDAAPSRVSVPATAAVQIQDFSFQPSTITVEKGTRIVFTNHDSVDHTVTAVNHAFGSPKLREGTSWAHTFNAGGTYKYYCRIHTYMRGEVIVKK
jgi:plastocyanin